MQDKPTKFRVSFLLFFALLLLSRLPALPVSEQPKSAEEIRIVSLSPNVTETLYALNAGQYLVGRSDYCNYPEEAVSLPSVGTLYNPSLESLLALDPTLVISSAFVSEQFLQSVESAGIEVLALDTQQSFGGTYDLIRDIAKAVGRQSEAELMILDMQNHVRSIALKMEQVSKPTVYVVIDFGSFDATATGDTYLGEMVELAGGTNIAKEATNWTYSKELLMAGNPQLLLLSQRWGESAEQTKQTFLNTKPYSDLDGEIIIFDSDIISRQSPRSAQALEQLARMIHPEVFK